MGYFLKVIYNEEGLLIEQKSQLFIHKYDEVLESSKRQGSTKIINQQHTLFVITQSTY